MPIGIKLANGYLALRGYQSFIIFSWRNKDRTSYIGKRFQRFILPTNKVPNVKMFVSSPTIEKVRVSRCI